MFFSLNLFFRYESTIGSKRRYHGSRVWMSPEETVVVFVQCFSIDVAKTSISNFGRVGTAFSGELHKPGPFALRQLLWPDFSTQNSKSFDSSAKVSLHVISLAVSDQQ